MLLVADGQRRLPGVPEGMLQGLRAEHNDVQDAAVPRPGRGMLLRSPVQPEQLGGAARQRYSHISPEYISVSSPIVSSSCWPTWSRWGPSLSV